MNWVGSFSSLPENKEGGGGIKKERKLNLEIYFWKSRLPLLQSVSGKRKC